MNICGPTGTQREAFSLNQLNFSTQTLLQDLYSMADYLFIPTALRDAQNSTGRQAGRDVGQCIEARGGTVG
jgi:hypothetical protein